LDFLSGDKVLINVISDLTRSSDWSYNRFADALEGRIKDVKVSKEPILGADIIHFIPYTDVVRRIKARYKIAWMGSFGCWSGELEKAIESLDVSIFENKNLYKEAVNRGVEKSKLTVITPPVDLNKFRPCVKIGIVARLKKTNVLSWPIFQKGEKELLKLFRLSKWPGFKFIFIGHGWKEVCEKEYIKTGVDVEFLDERPYDLMVNFYNNINYLLMPSRFESGPTCILEALACSTSVISTKTGLALEFHMMLYNNIEELVEILNNINAQSNLLRKQVEHLTYDRWATEHEKIYRGLIGCSLKENRES